MIQDRNKTLESFRQIEGTPLFTMEYAMDYRLEDFLKTGADSDLQLNKFVVTHLLEGAPMDYAMPDMGCSTFAAETKNGHRIFGRNFDEAECLLLVITTRPRTGYASISIVNLTYIGITRENPLTPENRFFLLAAPYVPLDGVNEKGLAVGVLKIRNTPTHQRRGNIGLTTTSAIRVILDRCATVDQAVELLSQYDMHSSANVDFHFQIADAGGNSAIVEYFRNEMKVVPGNCATNFLLAPDVGNVGSGHDRYEILRQTLQEKAGVFADPRDAMELLKAVSGASTRWSAVYDLTKPELLLSVSRDYEKLYPFSMENSFLQQSSGLLL